MTAPQPIQAQPFNEENRNKILKCGENIETQLVGIERIAIDKAEMMLMQAVYEIRDRLLNFKQRMAMHESIELAQIRNDLNPSMKLVDRTGKGVPPN